MISDRLAHFIAEMPALDIPVQARAIARVGIMDFVGAALAGSEQETGRLIVDYVQSMSGSPQCTVIGCGFKTSPYLAALANGTLGHILNFDDVSFTLWQGHPSVCLAPPLLALGESVDVTGADIVTAYIVGFEVGACIHAELAEKQLKRGWHGTSALGSIAASAAAARLLKLNVDQVQMALGIGASLSGGLSKNTGTMTKPLHAGQAASNGVMAALLAQHGFTADGNAIEGRRGYARLFGDAMEIDWDGASKALGRDWAITIPAHEFKRYPTAKCTRLVAATLELRKQHGIAAETVREIEFGVNPAEVEREEDFPENGLQAQFYIKYCVPKALLDGRFDLNSLHDDQVVDPQIKRLMQRTKFAVRYPLPVLGRNGRRSRQSVRITLTDGREYFSETPERASQMTDQEVADKYRGCARRALDDAAVDKSLTFFSNFEDRGIREMMPVVMGRGR